MHNHLHISSSFRRRELKVGLKVYCINKHDSGKRTVRWPTGHWTHIALQRKQRKVKY